MTCEVDWVTRDMFKNILSVGIIRQNDKVLGADTAVLEFNGKTDDLEQALLTKGYYMDRRYTDFKDTVRNKDLGRMYISRDLVYLKQHASMLFAHGEPLGSIYDIDCVYVTAEYVCLFNNGTKTLYKVYLNKVVKKSISCTASKIYNYKDKLFYITNHNTIVVYSIIQDCNRQEIELDEDIQITGIYKDSAYVVLNGRFATVRINDLLGGIVSC